MLLGVDVGGTFSDAVLALDDGRLITAKAPTTPADQSEGVQAAVEAALTLAGLGADHVREFSHGMTVATNALLEGSGARTAFVATDGFTDLIELGRQARPELYRLCAAGPAPLTPPERRIGVAERMTPDGPLVELTDTALGELVESLREAKPEAVAVTLLHAYRHPEHERRVGDAIADALPRVHVSLSHEVVGTFREYERAATTEVDASLSPLLGGYLRRLLERCDELGLPEPAIMQSNGGLIELPAAAAGAAYVARAAGTPDALCFDMGGTSCDVCVVDDGAVQEQSAATVAGRPLALPMVAVHTVGAGGGSIAWRDPGGALRVGPRSAGADPGPACYGRGGTEPTVTDANLVLGYLAADAPLAGGVALELDAALAAVGAMAADVGLSVTECAEGIVRVANAEMLRALRVVTVQRGIDPRRYALLCFGGAGGLHAAAIASELGISEIVCPRASGVLAALGLVVSPRRRDVQRSVLLTGDALTADAIAEAADELAAQASEQLGADDGDDVHLTATFELRYRGQAFELPISGALHPDPAGLRERFEQVHEERYGYRDAQQELELVTLRVSAATPSTDVELGTDPRHDEDHATGNGNSPGHDGGESDGDGELAQRPTRAATLNDERVQLHVISGAPSPGTTISGPAIVELPESTLLVPPRWAGTVDQSGTIHLHSDRKAGDGPG
jgi:N-methylhydantoinase A